MARISTYQQDTQITAEDHVIGTNQSPGHASETVIFPVSAIQTFLGEQFDIANRTTSFVQDINIGEEYANLSDDAAAMFSGTSPEGYNQLSLAHMLNTDNINYRIFIQESVDGADRFIPIEASTNAVLRNSTVYQLDNNTLYVEFPIFTHVIARVIITG